MAIGEPTMDVEAAVRECLRALNGRTRHCALHAFHHLERAESIVAIDPEMAMFRAITAEEEAATAVFFALRQRQYERATTIPFRNHVWKLGLYPFLMQINNFFASLKNIPRTRLRKIEERGQPRLVIEIETPDGRWGQPVPPLNMLISEGNGRPYHFERQLAEFASGPAGGSVQKHIEAIANTRNLLLYADESGRPGVVGGTEEMLAQQRKRVVRLNLLVSLIAPYSEKAILVQQSLNAFLIMMGRIDEAAVAAINYGIKPPAELLDDDGAE